MLYWQHQSWEGKMKKYTWAPTKKRSNPKIPDGTKHEVKLKTDKLIDPSAETEIY